MNLRSKRQCLVMDSSEAVIELVRLALTILRALEFRSIVQPSLTIPTVSPLDAVATLPSDNVAAAEAAAGPCRWPPAKRPPSRRVICHQTGAGPSSAPHLAPPVTRSPLPEHFSGSVAVASGEDVLDCSINDEDRAFVDQFVEDESEERSDN